MRVGATACNALKSAVFVDARRVLPESARSLIFV